MITVKTYHEGDRRIEEYDDKSIIYDYKYRIRDFFKPGFPEIVMYLAEAVYVSPITGLAGFALGAVLSKDAETATAAAIASAAAPQAVTYLLFRAIEAGLWKNDYLKREIRSWKKRMPYKPKITIEKIVDEETKE